MKEIMVLAVCSGMILMVLWVVVICLEKMKGVREREAVKERKKEEEPDGIISAIIAGIMAYEEGIGETTRKKERRAYERKEEKTSWWKMKERMKQTQGRG